jgi:hypothetical protein
VACVERSGVATRRGLNLLLLVDASPSVVLQPAWTSLTSAISAFVSDPKNAGVGVGVEYYGTSCTARDYETPAVPIADLPGNAGKIETSYPIPLNGKAIVIAMRGAGTYMRTVAAADPTRDAALVLVTDGVLDPLCGATTDTARVEAATSLATKPSVPTYVVGLGAGPSLITGTVDFTVFDAIAVAGGTDHAEHVTVNLTSNTELTNGLGSVVSRATPCTVMLPSDLDAGKVVLELEETPNGTVDPFPRVASQADCGNALGASLANVAGRMDLCPAACALALAHPAGTLRAREPCP